MSLMFIWDPWCIFVYYFSGMCITIINFKNLVIAMACTMNATAIFDNDLLFFHPCLSVANFILGAFIRVLW